MIRIILNGKKADLEEIRTAIASLRESSAIEVRVTWERGDAERFVREASQDGVQRIVAGGGDGTLNEVVTGLAKIEDDKRPELAILPLGTANDFATGCGVPLSPIEALRLAMHGTATPVDIVQVNDRYFINIASGGFGAQVSADTSPALKNFLGGGAYALSAVIKSLNFTHSKGKLQAENIELEGTAIMAAVCNGRQAGGGQVLAPYAAINDGLLDVMVVLTFPLIDAGQVLQEVLAAGSGGKYVKRFQTSWIESWPDQTRAINLDGEPYQADHIRFDVLPGEINIVLPTTCPCLINR